MLVATGQYRCPVCQSLWTEAQLLGTASVKKCGDTFCGGTVSPVSKDFYALTQVEANAVVREILRTSHSEEEIRDRLTQNGFSGKSAAITSQSHGSMFMAMVMVHGPNGETITG